MFKFKVLILCLLLFSCREDKSDESSILFLHYFTGSLSSGIDNLSTTVNKNQNDFNLVPTPMEHEEFKISLRVQLEGANPPDLFSYWAGARTKYLLDNDKIAPITDMFISKVDPDVFDESIYNACSYNGEIYLLPITRHFVGFFYNKKVFKDNNIDIPKTWDDLLTSAKKLKQIGIDPFALGAKNRWPAQFWFDYLLLRTSGYEYRERLMTGDASYSDPEVIKAVELWKELLDLELFGSSTIDKDWDEQVINLSKGEYAMTLMGTWAIPLLESKGLKPDEDYGFFQFPIVDHNQEMVSLGPVDGVLLSKASKNRDISMQVLYQLAQKKTQEVFNSSSGAIAPHILVEDSVYNPIQLQIKKIIKNNRSWAFNYDLATAPIISEGGLNFFIDFLNKPEKYKTLLKELEDYHIKNR